MEARTVQLVLHYDGSGFAGWQRQRAERTVQGVLEETLAKLCAAPVPVTGAGRTDAGVHARGQAAGVRVDAKWSPHSLRRALNATLPSDVWVAAAHEMRPEFHARYSAVSRRYTYVVGTDEDAASPFRRPRELVERHPLDRDLLDEGARVIVGEHCFRGFAVQGTAPETDDHRCIVHDARWLDRPGGLAFEIEANRFLHHMVRFLVGTMLEIARGRRPIADMRSLLAASVNRDVSPPAPAHALFLDGVEYPAALYLAPA
ncbi:MAG TPA: tRNA pseudouridine(38-40) synthase TruA [Gemmatimonadaceae bacterium]|nr:tRNA pseudouridine(38-40) synthase TruA [Gemmatimonadaceae bacterium]